MLEKRDKEWGLFWLIAFSIILLCCAVINSFAGDKWTQIVLSSNSIPSITTLAECTELDAYGLRWIAVTTKITFHVTGGSDVVVGCYTSPTGEDYDTIMYTSETIPVTAGETKQTTFSVAADAMYYKFKIDNSSSTYAISGATITITESN
jgi:hypothetical protein